jgi:hypothetical protein
MGIQIDTDQDGYGNICDADFTQNGVIDGGDIPTFLAALGTSGTGAGEDLNCNGNVDGGDIPFFLGMLPGAPGTSGLYCAGVSVPCSF